MARQGVQTLRSLKQKHKAKASKQPKTPKNDSSGASATPKPVVKAQPFRFKSAKRRVQSMDVDLTRLRERREMLESEDEAEDDATHSLFGHALANSAQLNLSLPFARFYKALEPLSRSLPLVVHHRERIVKQLCQALLAPRNEIELAGETILDLVPPLVTDLSELMLPYVEDVLTTLVSLTAPSPLVADNPRILERVYDVLAAIFRDLAREILSSNDQGSIDKVWDVVRRGLGAPSKPQTQPAASEGDVPMTEIEAEEKNGSDDDEADQDPVASTSKETLEPVPSLPATLRTTANTRRLLASAFAYLVRKAKEGKGSLQLSSLFAMMIDDVRHIEAKQRTDDRHGKQKVQEEGNARVLGEGIVWVVVESCLLDDGHLYSRADNIFGAFLEALVARNTDEPSPLLVQMLESAVIGLATRVHDTEELGSIVDALISSLTRSTQSSRQLVLLATALNALLNVKFGQTIREKHRKELAQTLPDIVGVLEDSSESTATAPIIELIGGVLSKSTITEFYAAKGERAFDRLYQLAESDQQLLSVVTLLSLLLQSDWPLFNHIALPRFLQLARQTLCEQSAEKGQKRLLVSMALAQMAQSKRLNDVRQTPGYAPFETAITDWCRRTFVAAQSVPEERQLLVEAYAALKVAPHLNTFRSELLDLIIQIINGILKKPSDLDRSEVSTRLLSSSLEALSTDHSAASPRLAALVPAIISRFPWHRAILPKLYDTGTITQEAISEAAESLLPNLLSEDTLLRSTTLKLLQQVYSEEDSPLLYQVLVKCIEIDDLPSTVQGAREKAMAIRKIGIMVDSQLERTTNEDVDSCLNAVVRFLIAMCKVNLRPLWPEAIGALALTSQRFAERVWPIVLGQLLLASKHDPSIYVQQHFETTDAGDASTMTEQLTQEPVLNSWHAQQSHEIVIHVMNDFQLGNILVTAISEAEKTPERLVLQSFEAQLLSFCATVPDLAQRHSRDFVETFLACFHRRPERIQGSTGEPLRSLMHEDETSKERKGRLLAWLGMFAKFSNPKALHHASELHDYFLEMLAFPDTDVQKLALDCVLRWKTASLTACAEHLKGMLDTARLRDELLYFVGISQDDSEDAKYRDDVAPVFIRLSFGIMTSKQGRSSSSSGQGRAGRRAAILGALRTLPEEQLSLLVDLGLAPFEEYDTPEGLRFADSSTDVSPRRQIGFLDLLADILKHLGEQLLPRWPRLLNVVLNILHFAQKGIESEKGDDNAESENVLTEAEDDADATHVPRRHIRQLAMKRLVDFCRYESTFDLQPYIAAAFPSIISPRLAALPSENAQSPSALLELFAVWSRHSQMRRWLVQFDDRVLPSLYACLTVRNVKPAVQLKVFDIAQALFDAADAEGGKSSSLATDVVNPSLTHLLDNLTAMLDLSPRLDAKDDVTSRYITLLCSISPYIEDQQAARRFVDLLFPMLRRPNKNVPEKTKVDLLRILAALLPLSSLDISSAAYAKCFDALTSLFATMRTRNGRLQVAAAFEAFATLNTALRRVASLATELNSYSKKRSEEPDFDRRLAAYHTINEDVFANLVNVEWIVVLQNMLFFVQDPEELAVRTSSSFTMRRLIERAAPLDVTDDIVRVVTRVLLPGLQNVLHSKLETVRSEVLGVYAYLVEQISSLEEIRQLKCLLVGGDEEANFFNNIGHIQVHRRTRAMRRLADEIEAGNIKGKIIPDLLLPLLDHFISEADAKRDAEVVNEAVQSIGRIARRLPWSAYNRKVQQYLRHARQDGPVQRASMRTLVACLKSFHFDLENDERVRILTVSKLLPQLRSTLEDREGVDLEKKLPIAEGMASVTLQVPLEFRQSHVDDLVTALAQFLREKDQNVRDLVRSTLANICVASGGSLLAPLVGEMKRALQRGPQMHILAYSLHAILLKVAESLDDLDLSDALEVTVSILVEDALGTPATDRKSDEFRAKTKFREVKSFKSMDSFQIVAEHVHPTQISSVLAPLRDQLRQTDSARILRDIDEILRRVSNGLVANKRLGGVELLELCHSLIAQNAAFMSAASLASKKRKRAKDSLVQDVQEERDFLPENAHHFVAFGLELFNAGFRKSRYDLADGVVLGRLEALVGVIGNTLYSDHPEVLARGMRGLASLIRCPLTNVDQASPVLVKQMLSVVQRSGSTESELVQSALRTLATVIRDCRSAQLEEAQLQSLLELIGPDLEEADRQATLFQLLRAIMSRKFVAPEIYDLMEKVATMLVTNQSSNVREVCRAIYLQFLLDYPQGKGRLKNSLAFLAKNLSFSFESGRLSVLELLNAVFSKFAPVLLEDSADLFFVSLVMVIANDESSRCREMAIELIKILASKVGDKRRASQIDMLGSWANGPQPVLARTSLQIFSAVIETGGSTEQRLATAQAVKPTLRKILASSMEALTEAEEEGRDLLSERDWQLVYHALQTMTNLFRLFPAVLEADEETNWPLWQSVAGHLLYPHEWVRASSGRLLGSLYASAPKSLKADTLPAGHPLSLVSLLDMTKKSCLQLKSAVLSDSLSVQIVKNVFFAAKAFLAVRSNVKTTQADDDSGDEDDDDDLRDEDEPGSDPLRWVFSRLSFQARQAHLHRPSMHANSEGKWSLQPMSILRLFAALINHMTREQVEPFIRHIASPIYRIVEDPNTQDPQMVELQELANEVQTMLANKVGTTTFANVYNELRQRQLERRRQRKAQAAIAAVTEPEKEAQRKAKRAEQKTRQKKRKSAANAERKAMFGQTDKKIKRRKLEE